MLRSHPAQYDTDCFWLLSFPHRDFLLLRNQHRDDSWWLFEPRGEWESHYLWQPRKQGREISHLIRLLFMPSQISANLPKHFHPFTRLLLPCQLWSELIAQKAQNINCWRNSPPITTVIRQSVGKTSFASRRTHVHTNHSFCKAYFPFLFRKLLLCSAALRRLCYANELYELCWAVALLSKPAEKSV